MDNRATKEQVEAFLSKVRDAVIKPNCFLFVNRHKNRELMGDLELSPGNIIEVLRNLDYRGYYRGPLGDRDYPDNEIYEFGICIDETEVYVKLAVVEKYSLTVFKCISINKAERPIEYPFCKDKFDE